jgi:very-short-patch-repair endonuclease
MTKGRNIITPYRKDLKEKARELRKHGTLSEVLLWQELKSRRLGYQFHRQVPMQDFIVDFYCHELMLAIEIDGDSHEHSLAYDANRQQRLEAEGVKFFRMDDKDVKQNMDWVIMEFISIIADLERG